MTESEFEANEKGDDGIEGQVRPWLAVLCLGGFMDSSSRSAPLFLVQPHPEKRKER